MPNLKSLNESYNEILDTFRDTLSDPTFPELQSVKTVIDGSRTRGAPDTPALWIFADTADVDHSTMSHAELWIMPVSIVSVVMSENPEQGTREAAELAAKAGDIILRTRRERMPAYVNSVTSNQFHPQSPWRKEDNILYASAYTLHVKFRVQTGVT